MTALSNTDLLTKVKKALGITGTYQDDTLSIYIDEVKEYLISAGVKSSVANSTMAVGVICRGVADLWNYGSSGTEFSNYFKERAIQLSYHDGDSDSGSTGSLIASAELNLDSNDVIKNGRITMSDGSTVPIELKYVPELVISMTPVTYESPMTTVTITPTLDEGHCYIYRIGNGYLPAYLDKVENPSIWKDWDGVSQIDTDGSSYLYILEVDDNYVTYRGGYVRINIL